MINILCLKCFSNILGIVDVLGNIVVKYSYNAWGTTSITQDTSSSNIGNLNPFRYKGYYYDGESGMYYCKTRYYVPLWGRWLNADSPYNLSLDKFNGTNYYAYCGNNPIIGNDRNGKFWFTFLSTIIGGIVGTISSVVSAICSGEEVTWKTAIIGFVDLVGTHPISAREYCDWHATGKWAGMILQVEDMSKTYYAYDFKNPRRLIVPIKVIKNGRIWIEIDDKIFR